MSFCSHQCRTNFLLVAIATLAVYTLFIEPGTHSHSASSSLWDIDDTDLAEIQEELDSYNPVRVVEYRSPLDERIFLPRADLPIAAVYAEQGTGSSRRFNDLLMDLEDLPKGASSNDVKFHRVWTMADKLIDYNGLWPNDDSPAVGVILEALTIAPIVGVDVLDIGDYESGTSDKWIATLMGGQKVVLKVIWGDKGKMKKDGQCNTGFEMPASEIAAFHLHRVLGFNNTPYVTGRKINVLQEIVPHASLAVSKQITITRKNVTCISGTCYNCDKPKSLCHDDPMFEFSVAYWIPRKIRLHTYPPKFMPFATPRMDLWGRVGFNNRSYCELVRRTIEPYSQSKFYLDLFDFAIIDTLMHHYDSKHYHISDKSGADGPVVRLDHGRAFCDHDKDLENIFLAPVTQCCTLRLSTYKKLEAVKDGGKMTSKLKALLDRDPVAPILDTPWYPALERRLNLVLAMLDRCISANGRDNVLIDDTDDS